MRFVFFNLGVLSSASDDKRVCVCCGGAIAQSVCLMYYINELQYNSLLYYLNQN